MRVGQFSRKIRKEARVRGYELYDAENWNLWATFLSQTVWVYSSLDSISFTKLAY